METLFIRDSKTLYEGRSAVHVSINPSPVRTSHNLSVSYLDRASQCLIAFEKTQSAVEYFSEYSAARWLNELADRHQEALIDSALGRAMFICLN